MSATRSTLARPGEEELRRLYLDEGKGCPEIGRLFERDPKTVLWWLREAGIPTRSRGSNPGPWFKPGHTNGLGRKRSPETVAKVRAATIRRGGVPYLRNGRHWLKGLPPEANPNWKGGATPERQTFYRSLEWKAACRAVWQRADAKCERCSRDFRTVDRRREGAFHVHHIVSFQVRELRAETANLALLCALCHRFVHSAANVARAFLPPAAAEHEASMPTLFDLPDAEALP